MFSVRKSSSILLLVLGVVTGKGLSLLKGSREYVTLSQEWFCRVSRCWDHKPISGTYSKQQNHQIILCLYFHIINGLNLNYIIKLSIKQVFFRVQLVTCVRFTNIFEDHPFINLQHQLSFNTLRLSILYQLFIKGTIVY